MQQGLLVHAAWHSELQFQYHLNFPIAASSLKQMEIKVHIVYIDGIVVTSDDVDKVARLKAYLSKDFQIKGLGKLRYFLGNKLAWSSRGTYLSQRRNVLGLLEEAGLLGCRPADSPN
ncbi:hypothetical protein RJ640_012359 [Escallonia rubra]|uniref:Reverse transcriptase Ty1/copia-type domain-containing protein n=1 Tax=Escallonia rubra TaxID=112253 RepID=A0AA88R1H0_9ASTE|nr:hypothetical protein RJ640_012359 [Escallonia rubra]